MADPKIPRTVEQWRRLFPPVREPDLLCDDEPPWFRLFSPVVRRFLTGTPLPGDPPVDLEQVVLCASRATTEEDRATMFAPRPPTPGLHHLLVAVHDGERWIPIDQADPEP